MRLFRVSYFVLGLFFIAGVSSYSTAVAQNGGSFDKQKMTDYLQKLAQEKKLMGSVVIDSAGQQVYQLSLGYKKLSPDSLQSDAETVYRIGSITKMFTAVIIFQLIDEGKITLETKLSSYYPNLPNADQITIQHLLKHQSGLYNFTDAPDYPDWMTQARTKEQMVALFKSHDPQFNPGSKTRYSNTNYVLLGYITEDITDESYRSQLQKRIIAPLNLANTYYGNPIDTPREAASFRMVKSKWEAVPQTDMSIPHGAGAIVSTPDDLTDFMQALFNGHLISEASFKEMTNIQERWGMGIMQIPFFDKTSFGHNGGIDGFQSHLSYFPDQDVTLAFTANGLNYSLNDILIGILSIYFGLPFEIPSFNQPTLTLSSSQKQRYIGSFSSGQLPMDIKIFIEKDQLKAQASGQPSFPLTATNDTTLRFDPAGVIMKFDSLSNNKFQRFTLNQSGGSFLFQRKE